MMLIHANLSSDIKRSGIFLFAVFAILIPWVISEENSSSTDVVTVLAENMTDSTAEETTVKSRRVRNNVIRYGAIYRGNSSRPTRAFTSRPKVSRRNKHRHSTRVDTTKLPLVLLPPVLTISRRSDDIEIEKHDPFVINVVSSEQPTTFTSSPALTLAPDSQQRTSPNTIDHSSKPFVDDKIMAMKNFGVRMRSSDLKLHRGGVKFHSTTPVAESTTHVLNDYTPPPKHFPTEQKQQQVNKQPTRRRLKGRTTTAAPEVTTPQVLPRENTFEFHSHDANDDYSQLNFDNLNYHSPSTLPPISDFTNSSLNEVLNYDVQRTSPRTIFSLDATGPVETVGSFVPSISANSGNYNNAILSDNSVSVSSPGTPTTHIDDFFSNVPEVSSSFVPRTEINVATSTSQFVENSTPRSNDGDFFLKDLLYPPLNELTPPYLEDEFHDQQGNVLPNVTQSTQNVSHFVTPSSELRSSVADVVNNGISAATEDSNVSAQSPAPQAAFRDSGDINGRQQQQTPQSLQEEQPHRPNGHTNTYRDTHVPPSHRQSQPQRLNNDPSSYQFAPHGSPQNHQSFQEQVPHQPIQQQQSNELSQPQHLNNDPSNYQFAPQGLPQHHQSFQQEAPHQPIQQQQPHEPLQQQHHQSLQEQQHQSLQKQQHHQPLQQQHHQSFEEQHHQPLQQQQERQQQNHQPLLEQQHQSLQEPQTHDHFNGFVPYQDYFGEGAPVPQQFFEPHQPLSQYTDCENGDCFKNQTFPNWTNVPISPADIKVLSNEDSIDLINKMYENLIRVLNGGPDYYDLSDEPQENHIDQPAPERKPISQKSPKASLQVAESGDIRNSRDHVRSQNVVQTSSRTSRRKDARGAREKSVQKRPMIERKATQLCTTKTLTYVADVSTGCKVFYVCTEYGIGEPMLCPNGTLFNQDYLVCDWWYNVDCS